MIRFLVCVFAGIASILYAIFPHWFLKRKYSEDEITPSIIKTARIVGLVLAAICAVLAVTGFRYI